MATTNTTAPGAQGSGISRRVGPFPLWVWVVGVGGVALWYYRRQQANTAALNTDTLSAGAAPTIAGVPATGSLDVSGGTNSTSSTPTLQDWATSALNALAHAGVAPALAEQAISDFIAGNPLSQSESSIINRALTLAGYPPETLPFYGELPAHPTPNPDVHKGSPSPQPAAPGIYAGYLTTENDVTQLAGRYGVSVPSGSALRALVAKLFPGAHTTDANAAEQQTLAAQVGYITSTAHLKTPTWAQINTQAGVIAKSHGQNFATLDANARAAYQQQANVALLEVLNPVRANG